MIKTTINTLLKTFTPKTKNLVTLPKAMFSTNPFNNPYGDKSNTMQNVQK